MNDSEWTRIDDFALTIDLLPLLRHLTTLGIACKVVEIDNRQQLYIRDAARQAYVIEVTKQWVCGELVLLGEVASKQPSPSSSIHKIALLKALPVTLITIALGFVGAALVALDREMLYFAEPLLFQPMIQGQLLPVNVGMTRGEYWRLLTPMFLHFGILHVVFNGILIWLIGHRIEIAKGGLYLFLILFITGLIANLSQFYLTPNTIFGGLSGAAYGLVGYIMVYQRLIEHPILHMPSSMLIMLMLSLFLGVFGLFDLFMGDSGIANGAHIGGLVAGILLGLLAAKLDKNIVEP